MNNLENITICESEKIKHCDPAEKDIRKIILSSEELTSRYADYKVNCLVPPLIFQNGINILAAERGSGKTRLALFLSFAICYEQKSFLGYQITKFGDILYLNFEIHEPEFKLFVEPIETYYQNQDLTKLHKLNSVSFLSYPNITINQIEFALSETKPILLIIDSFKAFASGILTIKKERELTNLNISIIYNYLNLWKQKYNVTILILNHTNKGTKSAKSHSDLMFGPSSLIDYADHTFLIRKTNVANQRLIVPDKSRFEAEGIAGINLIEILSEDKKLWFELIQEDVNESEYCYDNTKETKYTDEQKAEVITYFKQSKSIREIEKLMNIPKSNISRWIKKYKETNESN